MFQALAAKTIGTQFNDLLGQLGAPGGLIGAQIDSLAGNPLGVLRNLSDAFSEAATGKATTGLGRLLNERKLGSFGLVPTPLAALSRNRVLVSKRYYQRMDLGAGASTARWGRYLHPRRRAAAKFERLLRKNPLVRKSFEAAVGGKFIRDGRNDGKITVRRNAVALVPYPGLPPHLSSVASHIHGVQNAIRSLAKDLETAQNGSAGGSSSSTGPATSFEDMLFNVMIKQMLKLQKAIKDKGAELEKLQNKKAKKKKSGKGGGGKGKKVGKGGGKSKKGGKSEEQVTKELEQLTKKYERFLTSIDNIMSTLHKTSMNSIRKIGQ